MAGTDDSGADGRALKAKRALIRQLFRDLDFQGEIRTTIRCQGIDEDNLDTVLRAVFRRLVREITASVPDNPLLCRAFCCTVAEEMAIERRGDARPPREVATTDERLRIFSDLAFAKELSGSIRRKGVRVDEDVEDVLQQTYAEILRAPLPPGDVERQKAYSHGIARNVAKGWHSANSKEPSAWAEDVDEVDHGQITRPQSSPASRNEARSILRYMSKQMQDWGVDRAIVRQRATGRSFKEIAGRHALTEKAASRRSERRRHDIREMAKSFVILLGAAACLPILIGNSQYRRALVNAGEGSGAPSIYPHSTINLLLVAAFVVGLFVTLALRLRPRARAITAALAASLVVAAWTARLEHAAQESFGAFPINLSNFQFGMMQWTRGLAYVGCGSLIALACATASRWKRWSRFFGFFCVTAIAPFVATFMDVMQRAFLDGRWTEGTEDGRIGYWRIALTAAYVVVLWLGRPEAVDATETAGAPDATATEDAMATEDAASPSPSPSPSRSPSFSPSPSPAPSPVATASSPTPPDSLIRPTAGGAAAEATAPPAAAGKKDGTG